VSDKVDPTEPASTSAGPIQTSPRRVPKRMPETGELPDDLDWGDMRGLIWEAGRQAALHATPCGPFQDAAVIADAVTERLADQVPRLAFFGSNRIRPGENADHSIVVSLNGKLIRVSSTDPSAKEGWNQELYGLNWHEFDNLNGRLLTLCDATFTDPRQRKAFKDMVRQHVKEWVTSCIVNAAADAGLSMNLTAPFAGGIPDEELFGVEGQPTT
jgi:hypothetical protein